MLPTKTHRLYVWIVIVGLLFPDPRAIAFAPHASAFAWDRPLSSDASGPIQTATSILPSEAAAQSLPVMLRSGGSVAGRPMTNTPVFTATENFTTRVSEDTARTTAEWDITDGLLRLPPLSTAARQDSPAIVVDAAGNTIVVWQDDRNGPEGPDIYAQKFDSKGRRLWPEDVRVNSDEGAAQQLAPSATLDGNGDIVVVWADQRGGVDAIYAQKLNTFGEKMWNSGDQIVNNGPVYATSSDPAAAFDVATGHVVVVWDTGDIYAQRLRADGSRVWLVDVRVNQYTDESQFDPSLGADTHGNIYVAWTDTRNNTGCSTCPPANFDIYAQKLNSAGWAQWPVDVRVTEQSSTPGLLGFGGSRMTLDDEGSVYVIWRRHGGAITAQKLDDQGNRLWLNDLSVGRHTGYVTSPGIALADDESVFVAWSNASGYTNNYFVYAQKLSRADGALLWENDVLVGRSPRLANQWHAAVASIPGSQMWIAWHDRRNDSGDIYLQGLSLDGTRTWIDDVRVNRDPGHWMMMPVVTQDNAGNSSIVWGDDRSGFFNLGVSAQTLDPLGQLQWPHNLRVNFQDTLLLREDFSRPAIAESPAGALMMAWANNRNIYARRYRPNDPLAWPTERIVNRDLTQTERRNPSLAYDSGGYLYAAWEDHRAATPYQRIYLQKVTPDGDVVWNEDRLASTYMPITPTDQSLPAIAFDGVNNSLYVVWEESRNTNSIYLQRLDRDGHPLWVTDQIVNTDSSVGWQTELSVATAGGYAFVAWEDYLNGAPNVYAQKVSRDGAKQWTGDLHVGLGDKPFIAAGASGDNYVVWRAWNNSHHDIFAKKLDTEGNTIWQVRVNSDAGKADQDSPSISVDAAGNASIVWVDYRWAKPDIYAQKLLPDGSKVWPGDVRVGPTQLYPPAAEARSLTVDNTSGNILWATLSVSATLSSNAVTYELSNNGGADWFRVTPDSVYRFTSTVGSDLRWRATLIASAEQTETPVIDWLQIVYSTDPDPPNSVRVRDATGVLVPGALIYRNGQLVGAADDEGLFLFDELRAGDKLVALQRIYEQPTSRDAHDENGSGDFAYRIYLTSLPISDTGELNPYLVPASGGQYTLYIDSRRTLILFNLVISLEWDATTAYLSQVVNAARSASNYLFDLTDGQMAFGKVSIYDQGVNWIDADIQISARNNVHPHAFIGGMISHDRSQNVRLGRGWDGDSGDQGAWDQLAGFRTLAHEFAHYALHLYDEYFAYTFDESGHLTGEVPAYCTGPENRTAISDATNASAMDYQYTTSELSARGVPGLWSKLCEQTVQWQQYGESAWETVGRLFSDSNLSPSWQLKTPADRGSVMAGPNDLPPDLLPFPQIALYNDGQSSNTWQLTVTDPQGQPHREAIVALYTQDRRVIGQGLTDGSGRLEIYGAVAGDTLRATSLEGGLAGDVIVSSANEISLTLHPISGFFTQGLTSGKAPHLQVRAEPSPDSSHIDLLISLYDFGPAIDPIVIVTQPSNDRLGFAPPLSYNSLTRAYEGHLSLNAVERGTGRIRTSGDLPLLQSTYRLQYVVNTQAQVVYSDDGNMSLHLEPGSLPSDAAYIVVMPPGATPGPLPADLALVGDVYDVTASGALTVLERPAVLKLHYNSVVTGAPAPPDRLGLYRWDGGAWQSVPAVVDAKQAAVVASVRTLGTYALMAPPGPWMEPRHYIYMPVVLAARK